MARHSAEESVGVSIETKPAKAPYETIPAIFDFSRMVQSIDQASVIIQVHHGIDAASQDMLLGSYIINGQEVRQFIRYGVDGVIYLVRANIISGNLRYSLGFYLPVQDIA